MTDEHGKEVDEEEEEEEEEAVGRRTRICGAWAAWERRRGVRLTD